MSEREARSTIQNYYRNISRPKTLANRAVAAATCEICGDEWANAHVGWSNAEIFACDNCAGKTFQLGTGEGNGKEGSKEGNGRRVQCLRYMEPAISLHEGFVSFRCCVSCLVWLSEGEAEGSQRWKPAEADPWDGDEKLGHLFEKVARRRQLYGEPPAVASLCGPAR